MTSRISAVSAAAAALCVAAALAGCTSGSDSTVIEFQTAQAADSPLLAAIEDVTARYEQANPGVDIDLKTAGNDYEPQIRVRLAARDAPDIFATHGWSRQRYSGFLAPLQDEPWAVNFNPALATAMQDDDGAFYALPINTDVSGVIVNRDLLTAVGVAPEQITTWDDFTAAAEAVVADGKTALTLAGSKDGSAGNVIDWLAPGAFTADELQAMLDGEFPIEAYEQLLATLDGMRAEGWINPDYSSATGDDMARALAQGDAAFAFSTNFLISDAHAYNPDADLAFIPVPSLLGGEPYLLGGEDTAFGAAAAGENLAQAKDYLAFLAEPANISQLAGSIGTLPGLTDAEPQLGELQASFDQFVIPGEVPLEPYFDRVYLPNGMWETVISTADGVVAGQSSPAESARRVEADFATLFTQSR